MTMTISRLYLSVLIFGLNRKKTFDPNETQSEKEKEQIGNVQVGKENVVIGDFSGLGDCAIGDTIPMPDAINIAI